MTSAPGNPEPGPAGVAVTVTETGVVGGVSVGDRLPDLRALLTDGSEFVLSEDAGGIPIALVTGSTPPRQRSDVLVVHVAPPDVASALDTEAAVTICDDGRITEALAGGLLAEPAAVIAGHDHRVVAVGPAHQIDRLATYLPQRGEPVRRSTSLPLLTVADVIDRDLRQRLVDHADAIGWNISPMTRAGADGAAERRVDDAKARLDHLVDDTHLAAEIDRCLQRRLLPEIRRGFAHRIEQHEQYKIVRYDTDAGWFAPHRDNSAAGTDHRKLAVTINLDDGYEGGDLRFSELGPDLWRPDPGAAIVFSCGLLHEVVAVTQGRRHAVVTFLF